jgi:hypothetical protein
MTCQIPTWHAICDFKVKDDSTQGEAGWGEWEEPDVGGIHGAQARH